MPNWLPPLILFTQFNGVWEDYLEALHARFAADFLGQRPDFQGVRVGLKRHPLELGKEATFWHFISTGDLEEERVPEMRRCERISWPRAMIENSQDPAVKVWREPRGQAHRFHLWCEEAEYLVVLDDRGDFVLPWTAYPVERDHERRKLNRRYQEYK